MPQGMSPRLVRSQGMLDPEGVTTVSQLIQNFPRTAVDRAGRMQPNTAVQSRNLA
jgi:hypothetical protein